MGVRAWAGDCRESRQRMWSGKEEGHREGASSLGIREEAAQLDSLGNHRHRRRSGSPRLPQRPGGPTHLLRVRTTVLDTVPRQMRLCVWCFSSQTSGLQPVFISRLYLARRQAHRRRSLRVC